MLLMQKTLHLPLATDLTKMKKGLLILFLAFKIAGFSQSNDFIDVSAFYGMAIEHDKSLNTAIEGNPFGILLSYNQRKTEKTAFNQHYNYPDQGFSFIYQNFNSKVLGQSFSLYRHYTFYFGKNKTPRTWFLKTGLGLGYNTNPYDAFTNNQNFAFGSHLLLSGFANVGYQNESLWKTLGFKTGITLIHYSNASFKNPNLGLNTLAFTLGLHYNFENRILPKAETLALSEENKNAKIKFNFVFRSGLNQSKEIGSGKHAFYHFTGFASKKINYYSTLTAGVDYFITPFIKNYIPYYNATEFANESANNTDRIGVFVGHELTFNHFALVSQIGYHVHAPFQYISGVYERFAIKNKLSKHLFSEVGLKVNLFRAEALEIGIGYQF